MPSLQVQLCEHWQFSTVEIKMDFGIIVIVVWRQDERDGLRAAAAMASQGGSLSEARLQDREHLVDSLQVGHDPKRDPQSS